ncbi:phage tail protein [Pseudomonas sp. NPDC089530]|uniref:phage tail protein n=1 Tax=Pseudomonas sp. NPDC089530 TaxID=3390651 RepID=UPI003CFC9E76
MAKKTSKAKQVKAQEAEKTATPQKLANVPTIKATTDMVVVAKGAGKLDKEITGIRAKLNAFKKDLEDSGVDKLNFSSLMEGTGLVAPFVKGIKSAVKAEDELVAANLKAQGLEVPDVVRGSTSTNLKNFSASLDAVSLKVGQALLPSVNKIVVGLQPLLTNVGQFVANNPALVEGLAAAAVAFSVVASAAAALAVVLSPIGLAAAGIALAAGLIVANWAPLSGFFRTLWQNIRPVLVPMGDFLKTLFAFTPLGQIVNNWGPVSGALGDIFAAIKAVAGGVIEVLKFTFSLTPMGAIVANWGPISTFLAGLWQTIKTAAAPLVAFFQELFSWTPIALIAANWGPLTGLFSAIWGLLQALAVPVAEFLRGIFAWTPIPLIIANWGPITEFFASVWSAIKASAMAMYTVLSDIFGWTPLFQIIKNWEPITEWFSTWWQKLKAIIEPIKELLGGSVGGFITKITGKVESLTEHQLKTNEQDRGALAPVFFGGAADSESAPGALSGKLPKTASLAPGGLQQNSSLLLQQTAANNRTQLQGGLTVSFENAPAGLRTSAPQINQPGVALSSRVGYRSLSLGGSNELA